MFVFEYFAWFGFVLFLPERCKRRRMSVATADRSETGALLKMPSDGPVTCEVVDSHAQRTSRYTERR